jgi:hypothetical protein
MVTVGGPASSVAGVHLFYNNSAFDGNGSLVTASDFAAIASDKLPLGPGQTASFANISGYSRGINGFFVDFDALPSDGAGLDAGDFRFRVGNDDFPEAWPVAAAPASVGVLPNAAPGGADRAYVTFADHAVKGAWLRVTVLAGSDTGLSFNKDFFFGSAAGETGASFSPGRVAVDAADLQLIAHNITPLASAGTEAVTEPPDVNRDRTINAFDLQAVALNLNFNVLELITPQIPAPGSADVSASSAPPYPIPLATALPEPYGQVGETLAAKDAAMGFFAVDVGKHNRPHQRVGQPFALHQAMGALADEIVHDNRTKRPGTSIRDLAIESLTNRSIQGSSAWHAAISDSRL